MAALGAQFSIQLAQPAAAFGFANTPPFAQHDIVASIAGRTAYIPSGLRILKDPGILTLEPQPLLVDNLLGYFTGITSDWINETDTETGVLAAKFKNSSVDATFNIATGFNLDQDAATFVKIGRGQPNTDADKSPGNVFCGLVFGASLTGPFGAGNGLPVALILSYGRPPFLQIATLNNDGTATFSDTFGENGVTSNVIADCADLFNTNARVLTVEWLPLPGSNCIVCRLNNGQDTLVLSQTNMQLNAESSGLTYQYTDNLSVAEGPVQFYGKNGAASIMILPHRFNPSGTLTSGTIQIPFVYPGNGIINLPNAQFPDGCTFDSVIAADSSGTQIEYELLLTAPADASGLATVSPVITDILCAIPATFLYGSNSSGIDEVGNLVAEYEEEQYVEERETGNGLSAITVRTRAGVLFDNSLGVFTGGGGIHLAASISRFLTVEDEFGLMQPLSAPIPLMVGWTGMETSLARSDPYRRFDAVFMDKAWPLERVDMGVQPYFDDWCFLSAMRYLLNCGGVLDDFIDPLLQTCDFGANPVNCPHFHLPIGTGTSPKMAFGPNTKYWDGLCEICSYVHGVMGFDATGIFRIFPYYPFVYNTPFKGTFQTLDDGDPTSDTFLQGIWNALKAEVNTRDVRTGVAFIGYDPGANQVQGTYLNADDYLAGFTQGHGFRDPLVAVSNTFVDPLFTEQFAISALSRVVQPSVTIDHGACFLPGFYCLDRYAIEEYGFVIGGVFNLSLERIRNTWRSHAGKVQMEGQLTGRAVYNL